MYRYVTNDTEHEDKCGTSLTLIRFIPLHHCFKEGTGCYQILKIGRAEFLIQDHDVYHESLVYST